MHVIHGPGDLGVPVNSLEAGPGNIEEVPTFLVFCETSSDDEKKDIEESMSQVAKKFLDKQKDGAATAIWKDVSRMKPLPPAPHEHELPFWKEKGPGWGCDGCGQDGSGKDRFRCSQGGTDLRRHLHVGKAAEKEQTQMVIIDIPSDGALLATG
eukprot:Skav215582  [mRNA]  locus=scaffold666:41421:43813:+ [translate_table: standard]